MISVEVVKGRHDELNVTLIRTQVIAVSEMLSVADPEGVSQAVGRLFHRRQTHASQEAIQEAVLDALGKHVS